MAATRLRIVGILAALAVSAVLVVDSTGLLSAHTSVIVDDSAQLVGAALAVVACVWTACRATGVERTWRLLMAVGMAGWAIGQLLWSFYQVFELISLPSPSAADVGYLTLPVFALLALLAIAAGGLREYRHGDREAMVGRQRIAVRSWPVVALDSLVVVASMLILTWATALGAVIRSGAPTWNAFAVAIAYPITDLILVVIVILLLALWPLPRRLRPQLLLLGLGLIALSASDSIFAYIVAEGGDSMPPLTDAGFVAGPVLVGLAALAYAGPAPEVTRHPGRRGEWTNLLLPYLPLAATEALLFVRAITRHPISPVVQILSTFVVFMVVARQVITLTDNQALLEGVSMVQEQLRFQASHDSLTGLPNRSVFWERLAGAVEQARRGDRRFTLFFIDIDKFKSINDNYGHGAGDAVLREVAVRLRSSLRRDDTVARLGGDEFGALVEDNGEAADIGERIRETLRKPFDVDAGSYPLTASVGSARLDGSMPGLTADALLNRADARMYADKRRGRGHLVTPESAGRYDEGELTVLLTDALTGDPTAAGLDVHYQPIVRIQDGRVIAVEALARWVHPNAGPIPTAVFVAAAERAALIGRLDDFVLDRACHDLARHLAAGGAPMGVYVNISAGRLGDPAVETAARGCLDRYDLSPDRLMLEVTESARIPDLAAAAAGSMRLRADGIRVAMDDFGAGYNTLALLYELPLDVVKLDRRLIDFSSPAANGSSPEALSRAVVSIVTGMGLLVIAEGVETSDQAAGLNRLGVRCAQGDWYSPPAPFRGTFPIRTTHPRVSSVGPVLGRRSIDRSERRKVWTEDD